MQASLGIAIEHFSMLLEIGDQVSAMPAALVGIADGVQLQADIGQAEIVP